MLLIRWNLEGGNTHQHPPSNLFKRTHFTSVHITYTFSDRKFPRRLGYVNSSRLLQLNSISQLQNPIIAPNLQFAFIFKIVDTITATIVLFAWQQWRFPSPVCRIFKNPSSLPFFPSSSRSVRSAPWPASSGKMEPLGLAPTPQVCSWRAATIRIWGSEA